MNKNYKSDDYIILQDTIIDLDDTKKNKNYKSHDYIVLQDTIIDLDDTKKKSHISNDESDIEKELNDKITQSVTLFTSSISSISKSLFMFNTLIDQYKSISSLDSKYKDELQLIYEKTSNMIDELIKMKKLLKKKLQKAHHYKKVKKNQNKFIYQSYKLINFCYNETSRLMTQSQELFSNIQKVINEIDQNISDKTNKLSSLV